MKQYWILIILSIFYGLVLTSANDDKLYKATAIICSTMFFVGAVVVWAMKDKK